jgi:hypothetical protein
MTLTRKEVKTMMMTSDHEAEHSRPDDVDPAPGMHPWPATLKVADSVARQVAVVITFDLMVDLTDYDPAFYPSLIDWALKGNVRELVEGLPKCVTNVKVFSELKP